MNKIHTAILALVMSIFLIQAIDPPFEKQTGTFLQFYPINTIPQARTQQLISKDGSVNPESSTQKTEASNRQDNFPYSLTTELKPPPIIETHLKPPPPPPGSFINSIPDNHQQSSENIPQTKKNKELPGFRYLDVLELDLPALPIENSNNNGNSDSLYPPLNIESYLEKLTPDQIQVLNQKIPENLPPDQLAEFQQHFKSADSLARLRDYLTKIKSEYQSSSSENAYTIASFNGSTNENILGKDFIKPLLQLYENEIHHPPGYATDNSTPNSNGNFGEIDEEINTFTQNELHLLIHGTENDNGNIGNSLNAYNEALIVGNGDTNGLGEPQYYNNNSTDHNHLSNNGFYNEFQKRTDTASTNTISNNKDTTNQNFNQQPRDVEPNQQMTSTNAENHNGNIKNRRDDNSLTKAYDKEHIGEILPPNFKKDTSNNLQVPVLPLQVSFTRKNYRMRKSFEPIPQSGIRRVPFAFPGERFRPEYEPSGISADGVDLAEYQRLNLAGSDQLYPRAPRLGLPPTEVSGYRLPRRYRGFRETTYSDSFQPYFDNSARYQAAWSVRKPRVIFPTDLVAFRDSEQNGSKDPEPDWLSADNQLQDIQEQDTRDRGELRQIYCSINSENS